MSRVEGVRAAAVAAGTVGFLFSILFSIFRFLFSVSCFLVLGFWFQVAGCTRVAAEPVVVGDALDVALRRHGNAPGGASSV